ncbi:hypothetical protein AB1Y20_014898 [Prymnesium parvum]|uniref:H(+)-exporting diphosphatase n=1 Tax=Prymnesium parvum TaxID=97485 RepID=A0AB34JW82_PRYPA
MASEMLLAVLAFRPTPHAALRPTHVRAIVYTDGMVHLRAHSPSMLTILGNDSPVPLPEGFHASGHQSSRKAIGDAAYASVKGLAKSFTQNNGTQTSIDISIQRIARDMELLDNVAASQAQLGNFELAMLTSSVLIAAGAPFFVSMKLTEVLVPSMSALSAAIGISAEYTGRVAVSRGKEVAAVALQAAAESETLLAQAERSKAVIPLCVGLATTASAFALLAPALVAELAPKVGVAVITEIYLVCPLFAVLAAAVAALATQEAVGLSGRAAGTGTRRFASSSNVGRTWLSATEQIDMSTTRAQDRWKYFCLTVLPAPIFGVIIPGELAFRAIVIAAVAAAQAAYQLSQAEYAIAIGQEAVAMKSRSAAIADTYANQGARAGAILPFTSALSGLCAATTVALVEVLPFISAVPLQSATGTVFPAIGAVVAAAASISKTRCELDAAAANQAATELAFAESKTRSGRKKGPILGVVDLVVLTLKTNYNFLPRIVRVVSRRFVEALRVLFGPGGGEKARE